MAITNGGGLRGFFCICARGGAAEGSKGNDDMGELPAAISYLSNLCHCQEVEQNTDNRNGMIHVVHHNKGKRSTLRNLPPATLSKVEYLTSADVQIYTAALRNFIGEMAWLESDAALGRRVLCPNILERWELDLPVIVHIQGHSRCSNPCRMSTGEKKTQLRHTK